MESLYAQVEAVVVKNHKRQVYLNFDGSCAKNPGGPGGWSFRITDERGRLLRHDYGDIDASPDCTVNTCEWQGLIYGLVELAREHHRFDRATIRGDSALVINIARGKWKAKKDSMHKLMLQARDLMRKIGRHKLEFEWIPREKNTDADDLSRDSMARGSRPSEAWDTEETSIQEPVTARRGPVAAPRTAVSRGFHAYPPTGVPKPNWTSDEAWKRAHQLSEHLLAEIQNRLPREDWLAIEVAATVYWQTGEWEVKEMAPDACES